MTCFATLCDVVDVASYFQRKDSPFYWIRFKKPDGRWVQRSSGVRVGGKGGVRKMHQLVAEESAKEALWEDDGSSAMFRHWVPGWIGYAYANTSTRDRCLNAWAHLSCFFEERGVVHPAEVSYQLAHHFMRWRTDPRENEARKAGAWNTAVLEIRVLGAIMQEALRRGWVMANPCARLGLTKRRPKEKRPITREEEALIFEMLREKNRPGWMGDSFLVAMRQGCRLTEVGVPLERIDTRAMTVTFRVKGGGYHTAPLHKDLLALVAARREAGEELLVQLPKQASPQWGKFLRSIGLGDLCFHCTRVTVVTRLCEAGFSESQTMAYVGHASEAVHAIYRKIRPAAVAALGAAL